MTTTWTIAIDWDRNGDYTGTYDNVTRRVISANWFLGRHKPYQVTSTACIAVLHIPNSQEDDSIGHF